MTPQEQLELALAVDDTRKGWAWNLCPECEGNGWKIALGSAGYRVVPDPSDPTGQTPMQEQTPPEPYQTGCDTCGCTGYVPVDFSDPYMGKIIAWAARQEWYRCVALPDGVILINAVRNQLRELLHGQSAEVTAATIAAIVLEGVRQAKGEGK